MWNKEQQEAMNTIDGAVQVIAAAGSGKSSVLKARVEHMVNDLDIDEKDILVISFTNATASELKKDLEDKLLFDVTVGTFHSICKMLLEGAGYKDLLNQPRTYMVKREMEKVTGIKNINIEDVLSFINYQKAFMIMPNATFKRKECAYEDAEIRACYRAYENYKQNTGTYDFDDWIINTINDYESEKITKTWKYVLIDEFQDLNMPQYKLAKLWCPSGNIFAVGDISQCWEENCEVRLQDCTIKKVKDLQIGDLVECNRGGSVKYMPVTNKTKHISQHLIKITTKQGYTITTTADHKFFVHDPVFDEGIIYLYLMFSYKQGFRIGLTAGGKTKDLRNRINAESPDKLWILRQFINNKEEAYYQEEYYSLKYRIPKIPFHTTGRGMAMGQEKTDAIFNEFGENGFQLLRDFDMDFNYPNYVCQNTRKQRPSVKLYHYAEHNRNVRYSAEFEYNGKRIRKASSDFKTCYIYAQEILRTTEADSICERLSMPDVHNVPYRVVCGSNVMLGMDIPVVVNGEFCNDIVTDIEYISDQSVVYDVEVASSGTMVANNILTHNCIYEWRGASPMLFANFHKEFSNTRIINMNTNYRSSTNIVERANKFIKPYSEKYGNYKDSVANNQGDGHIETHVFDDNHLEADAVVDKIKELIEAGVSLDEITVLYRNNANADIVESLLKKEGIEYTLMSSQSFFDKKEIKGIIALLRLIAHSNDDEAFEICMNEFRCYPLTYFKKELIEDLLTEAGKRNCSLFEAFMDHHFELEWQTRNKNYFIDAINRLKLQNERRLPVDKLVDNVVRVFKITNMIYENYESNLWDDKLDSVNNLREIAKGYMLENFLTFAESKPRKNKKTKGVVLRTVHSAKGLESRYVFLISLQDDKFPSSRSSIDEEAHILYVGVTRAREWQWVSSIGKSRFFEEYSELN